MTDKLEVQTEEPVKKSKKKPAAKKETAKRPETVTNNTESTLVLFTGERLAPKASVKVKNLDVLLNHSVTKTWIDAEVLTVK